MGAHGGPDIVTDNLIFAIDAGSPKCFTSGATTATCLVSGFNCSGAFGNPGSGTHTPDASNFPAYNSLNGGIFDFNGSKGINIDGDLGSTTASTISMWFYKKSSGTHYFTDGRNNGGTWFLSNYTSDNINWNEKLTYDFEDPYNASASDFLNQWIHMVACSDGDGSKLYLNGIEVSTSTSTSADEDFGINYRIGTRYTTSNEWTGYMGPIYFYNKKLNAGEALQNFNAQRSRFGQ
ncbi:LamG domain-containing protein [Marine Group I thaumarchaeote]|uniref:LamG domain-containing protein n=1 Tax=Marine Group I thaumarchaeote TaxID=2511932 RepID=A0A7K4MR29_9ARCH|nr:LamG domain-containing protein [Marine Group I thaumarchaeote]